MTYYFMDSSALIKRYVSEVGTTWIRSITVRSARNIILIAHVTQVEIVSGAMRRKRDGTTSVRTAHAVRLLVDRYMSREYRIIGLTGLVVQQAEDLLERYPLRAYDSVQLASALVANSRLTSAGLIPLIFISSDARLLTAAIAEGLTVDDPSAHP